MEKSHGCGCFISLNEFKKRVIDEIERGGISISELARISGIKQSTLHKGLFGDRELTFSNATSICNVLGVPLLRDVKNDCLDTLPVIHSLSHLKIINDIDLRLWDDCIVLDRELAISCIAVNQKLFDCKIFPINSVIIVDTRAVGKIRTVYINGERLSLDAVGGIKFGTVVGIIFRMA